ncbi:hypothetical protein DFH27DRAFT_487497 [Peziza echinospora]|nr:hypothetical protein DFH27DRAFT_487497 [Peziza echinospora]
MGLESETGILHTVDAEEISHSRLTLVCELVRKVDGVRAWALEILKSAEQLSTITVSAIVRAVLDSLSTPKERKFQWKASVNDNTKQVIQNAISAKGDDLVQNGLENVDVLELFRKAASLFPTLNTTTILKQMLATDKKQKKDSHTNITPEAISFISSLIGKRSGKDGLDREKKAWYLVVVDHLTRRFGEEKVLTSKSAGEAKEFAELLRVNGVLLGKWVPRGSLNALLEAVVEKKIEEESAVALASVVVSQAEAAELDLAKLLQMILGNAKNPLATREAGSTTTIHYHMAYLIHRLFTFSKNIHSNITTMDSLMLLYRGTCSIVDRLILNMLMYIEGFLTRSCASRVATWTFLEDKLDPTVTSSSLLISRAKTKLAVNIDEKMLLGTVAEFAPEASMVLKEAEFDRLEEYLEAVKNQNVRFERQYDQSFMLPILAYVVSLQDKTLITAQAMVEKGALGYAVLGLCSQEQGVRRAATQLLSAIVARLEESTYKARNQITHLICALLASLEGSPLPTTPLPTVVGIFLAHAAQALTDPAHFLYEKLMELLLRSPLLDLWDIPYLLSVLGNEEDYYKEAIWKLTILAQGLRTPTDLGLYRKRRVVESVCAMYSNPYAGERTRERVLDLLWSLAEVGGGGETAVTRNGVVAWVEQQLVMKKEMAGGERAGWKVVVARLCEGGVVVAGGAGGAGGGHVREWSKGGLVGHLNEVFCS